MKTLIIMRHGEAESNGYGSQDKARELTKNGIRDVLLKGHWMKENNIKPEVLLVSDAARTTQTAQLILERSKVDDGRVFYKEALYNAPLGRILEIINDLDDQYECVMLIAHNPGVSYLTEYLTDEHISFIPSGIVKVHFELDHWAEISKGLGMLELESNDTEG